MIQSEFINPELVNQINIIVAEWRTANTRMKNMLHGWEQRAALAGLERGAMIQIGRLPGASAISDYDDFEQGGREVYEAWMRGNLTAAVDLMQ